MQEKDWVEMAFYGLAYKSGAPKDQVLLLGDLEENCVVPIQMQKEEELILFRTTNSDAESGFSSIVDMFGALLNSFSIKVKDVKILGYDKGVLCAEISFEDEDRIVTVASTAVTALAIALRAKSKIFITKRLYTFMGERYVKGGDGKSGELIVSQSPMMKRGLVERLEEELEEAVRNEEYERAGELKVKINNIKGIKN